MKDLLQDSYGRTIRDLRISLTDRCNFRCFYCRPVLDDPASDKAGILTYEEIFRICGIFTSLGIRKIRLTGGEPLLRRDIDKLIRKIARLKADQKLNDLALTTNGFSLPERAGELRRAGLDRVTISLDSLKRENFRQITGADKLDSVLEAIESAKREGLNPVKINTVVIRGRNDDEIVDFARFAREMKVTVRFIEFMPLDSGEAWQRGLMIPGREVRDRIETEFPLVLRSEKRGTETAWKYGFSDGAEGGIGIISSVTEMFCGGCSRIRLTADGQLRTCLFSGIEHDLRGVIRSGAGRREIIEYIGQVVLRKEKSHRINETDFVKPVRTMSRIGG